MNTPWFNPNLFAWIPGTAFGVLCGLWGSLAGVLAPRGRARRLVLGMGLVLALVAVGFLAASVVALTSGQPYGVWYGLGLPGLLGLFLVPMLLPVVWKRYAEAETRKMGAQDLPV
jgi:uncharacterized membrane protein